jgi:hypothetical protein
MPRRGRPENLKRGREKGDPPTRTLSDQKVTDFCWSYLTNGESRRSGRVPEDRNFNYGRCPGGGKSKPECDLVSRILSAAKRY